MPGIAGIIGPGDPDEQNEGLLRMVRSMAHEPFYTGGTYSEERLRLRIGWHGHGGAFSSGLPVWNEAKDIALIASGEDFSDPEEIDRLRARGHHLGPGPLSHLVHLYEDDGPDFARALNGRFSGLIADRRQDRLVLFNDRFGLDRIFFFERGGAFYFASEAKALLRIDPGLRRVDPKALGEWFACGCVLQDRTLFEGVKALPGASAWVFRPGRDLEKRTYFRKEEWENREPLDAESYYRRLEETWAHVLPRYLRGDEPVAVSLTGGKDSRMIMAWARPAAGALPCYTFRGPYRECRDVLLARRVASLCGQPHDVIGIGPAFFAEFPSLAERAVCLTDGAMSVGGAPELFLNRLARDIAPVRLTGNYGQEILRRYIAFRPHAVSREVLHPDVHPFVAEAARTYHGEAAIHTLSFVAFKQMPWYHSSRLALEKSQLALRSPFLDRDLVALAYQAPVGEDVNMALQMRLIAAGNPALSRLPTDRGDLLRAFPGLAAAGRLFQQFTFKAEYAYDYGMPPWLTRVDRLLRPLRPERLFLGRHKFAHFRVWYRDELAAYVKDMLLDPRTLNRPYVRRAGLEKIVREHLRGDGNHTTAITQFLSTELVHRRFVDTEGGAV